jgi:hypothetical protein
MNSPHFVAGAQGSLFPSWYSKHMPFIFYFINLAKKSIKSRIYFSIVYL